MKKWPAGFYIGSSRSEGPLDTQTQNLLAYGFFLAPGQLALAGAGVLAPGQHALERLCRFPLSPERIEGAGRALCCAAPTCLMNTGAMTSHVSSAHCSCEPP